MAKFIEKSAPNGHRISLQQFGDDAGWNTWTVFEDLGDGEVDEVDFDSLDEARAYYANRVAVLTQTPNWEAQARYDEEHGTDNGYDPNIERFRNEH